MDLLEDDGPKGRDLQSNDNPEQNLNPVQTTIEVRNFLGRRQHHGHEVSVGPAARECQRRGRGKGKRGRQPWRNTSV